VATKIKLMRLGKMREPHYRIVVADSRTKRDGRAIEAIGEYHPKADPSVILVDADRVQYWLGVGAQPTEAVAAIFRVTGDWQRFRGEPAPEPMKTAAPPANKKAVFEEAARQAAAGSGSAGEATTPRKRAGKTGPAAEAPPGGGGATETAES
jgi:small subunit ribosomal protein S16